MITIRLAIRDWDYFTPLLLGDVKSDKFQLELHRVNHVIENLADDPHYDAAEISLSRYAMECDAGRCSVVGIPHFLRRGFCHRTVITRKESPLENFSQLANTRIGLSDWQASEHIWTRGLLHNVGVNIGDIDWFCGRLSYRDAVLSYPHPDYVKPIDVKDCLLDLLEIGELDAVLTSSLPAGFFKANSAFRHLTPYFRHAEYHYFRQVGYVPGLHILALKNTVYERHPWLAAELSQLIDQSRALWWQKRQRYGDTTPWMIDEIRQVSLDLPVDWNKNGYQANEKMIAEFCHEVYMQELSDRLLTPADLFAGNQQ